MQCWLQDVTPQQEGMINRLMDCVYDDFLGKVGDRERELVPSCVYTSSLVCSYAVPCPMAS
jgi:hypothetical protein